MIFTESTIKISNNVSKMDSTIVLYRGDKNVEIRFTILQSPFKYSNTVATNVIESTNASYGQLVIKTPNDKPPIFSEVSATKEGTVLFTITKEMIDEIEELGVYTFQIRLMDENKQSRVTIPPVENGIEIKEPIAIEDDNTTNVVGLAKANYAVATLSDVDTPVFDDNGQYIKTNWNDGDIITNASLNKIEDGIYTTNENVTATKKYVDDKVTVKILPVDYNKSCATNVADLEPHSIYMSPNDAKFLYLGYEKLDGSFSGLFLSGNPHGKFIYTGAKDDTKIEVMLEGICHTAYFKTDTVDPHTEKTVFYLTKNNTTEYTPTNDYSPATKKYVDDNKITYTVSSKVLATIPASDIKIDGEIAVNNISINKDRRYYIEFLGSKKLCSLLINGEIGDFIICSIGNYSIEIHNNTFNISIYIDKINTSDTTDTFTDLIIYEEEVKYLDNKYLETDLTLQNSISLGRIGDIGTGSSAIGLYVTATGDASHAEGSGTAASGKNSHAEGDCTTASADSSHAEGSNTTASGLSSHTEGNSTTASGKYAHAEGDTTTASGDYGSHAEGSNTIASGVGSHAEGFNTTASAYYSHAEGDSATASGENSHAEGKYTTAYGTSSHAEGDSTTASAYGSHAEGNYTTASGDNSHAEGASTIASSQNQHVQGKYNIEDANNKYAHIVGNGEDGKNSNAHTLDWEGNAWFAGKLTQEGTPTEGKDLTTKKYVDDNRDYYFKVPTILYDDPNLPKGYVDISTLETGTNYRVNSSIVSGLFKVSLKALNDDGTWFTVDDGSNTIGWSSMLSTSICVELKSDTFIGINMSSINNYCKYLSITKENGKWKLMQTKLNSISPDNMYEYDVVNDYNPATKKYVDDKVTSLPQLSFNEAGELVVTINGVSKTFVPKNV